MYLRKREKEILAIIIAAIFLIVLLSIALSYWLGRL
jgi:uncharacterized protein YpmB